MKIPFFDIKRQYTALKAEIEPQVLQCLESCSYIGGEYVSRFEHDMEQYLGVRHAMGCASGTSALVLALRACGVNAGDEVITTPFTFFATAEAVATVGAIPVFVDICPDNYNIDPHEIEKAITDKTKAILPVHIFGAPCDMDAIIKIAKKHSLKVIEDCAQAIGSEYHGKKSGTIGHIGCFSFYPTKNLGGCGDGGMVVTNDDDLYTILQALHEHGAGINGAKALALLGGGGTDLRITEEITEMYNPYKYYNYLIGYNDRLDALQAAALTVKLRHLDEFNQRRARIADEYCDGLTSAVGLPHYSPDTKPCWHQFVIRSKYKQELCCYLGEKGIGSGSFYPVPLHRQKAFNSGRYSNIETSLSAAEALSTESVCLPIFPEMTEEEVCYVIAMVNQFYEAGERQNS